MNAELLSLFTASFVTFFVLIDALGVDTANIGLPGAGPHVVEDVERLEAVLEARSVDSHTFFGRMHAQWDALRTELFGTSFILPALLGLLPGDPVVAELGCGTGPNLVALAPVASRVIGIDREARMLDAARQRVEGIPNVELRQAVLLASRVALQGVLFTDAGNAWNLEDIYCKAAGAGVPYKEISHCFDGLDSLLTHRTSYGFGVRWFSPLGPLRFEWGFPFKPLPYEETSVFEFTIGNFF